MAEQGWFTSRSDDLIGWARKWSIFQYPFATACCSMVDVRGVPAAARLDGGPDHG
jgi:NADH:ubiquinone oxidoreductase subunit B-like Fe-S oxidoreductase